MRAMWTAATGMHSMQMAIDNTSNNLANVNTTAYKNHRIEFEDLLYQKMDFRDGTEDYGSPVALEIGHGVMPSATVKQFMQGSLQATQNPLDVALEGDGFFVVSDPTGKQLLTRDGSFQAGFTENGLRLMTSDGYLVSGVDGEIDLSGEYSDIAIDKNGKVSVHYVDSEEGVFTEVGKIKLVDVANPAGLSSIGDNFYVTTPASGQPFDLEENSKTKTVQGYLEMSNVQVVQEMVNLIVQQRAYEANSKTIQTADSMLDTANNVKR